MVLLGVIGTVGNNNSLSSRQITERSKPEADKSCIAAGAPAPVGTGGPWQWGLVAGSGVAHGAGWW